MTTRELLLIGARVNELRKEGLINIGDDILLREEAFDQMFPTGWDDSTFTNGAGETVVIRSIKIDGQKFVCVR